MKIIKVCARINAFAVFDKKEITFPDGESIDAKWVTIDEFIRLYNNEEIVPTVDFGIDEYHEALSLKQIDSYKYIGLGPENIYGYINQHDINS